MQNKHQSFFLVLGVPTLGEGGGSTWLGQIPNFFQKIDLKASLKTNTVPGPGKTAHQMNVRPDEKGRDQHGFVKLGFIPTFFFL